MIIFQYRFVYNIKRFPHKDKMPTGSSNTDINLKQGSPLMTTVQNRRFCCIIVCCTAIIGLFVQIAVSHSFYLYKLSEITTEYVHKKDFHRFLLDELQLLVADGYQVVHNQQLSSKYIDSSMRDDSHSSFRKTMFDAATDAHKISDNTHQHPRREKRGSYTNGGDHYNYVGKAPGDEAHVEFFNPDYRTVLEAKDDLIRQQAGSKGAAPGGDSWVWLTSYCRIPEKALQGYCTKVHQFCPPGRAGPTGSPGLQGLKGDRGDKGFPGIPGQIGPRGPPGPIGDKGVQGRPGLDGRDGIPGEPGLDGMPGRNGLDGISGVDGLPGLPGKDGFNGTDGSSGQQGLPGPQGPPGPRGLTGPRGRPGRAGTHGTPGIPGVTVYKLKGDSKHPLLIPPSIAGLQRQPIGPIIVHEGENVRLHCSATGVPNPHTTWQKLGKDPINRGAWEDIFVPGNTLNITKVHRSHMGLYLCIADNGIPPQVNQSFNLEVHFPPLIRIRNQMIPIVNGSTAVLTCETEAFPEPIRFWERSDGRLLENDVKYHIDNSVEKGGFKFKMQLNISQVTTEDLAYLYACISKNELHVAKGEFTLYEPDPWRQTSRSDGGGLTIFGSQPPEKVSLEDICGPPVQCPECSEATSNNKDLKCSASGVSLIDLISRWEIRKFGDGTKYTPVTNRTTDCVLYAVGKPVYHRFSNFTYGSWMRDVAYRNLKDMGKTWVTREDEPSRLYQFDNKTTFRKDLPSKTIVLDQEFSGNAHVVYDGHFFYNAKDSNKIIKYSLFDGGTTILELPFIYENETAGHLYAGQHNYMDFSVDDNGLWIVFPVPNSNNTAIMKLNASVMEAEYIWNVSINHRKVGEMFVVCGVLYAVDSVKDSNTKIRFALDLYKNKLLDVNLIFTNPFRLTTMITYDYRNKELYTWDKGNQLTYPVRYHEIGYNFTGIREEQVENLETSVAEMHTGYDIY